MLISGNRGLVVSMLISGNRGLVVSMLISGTRVRGFKPGRSRWIFRASEKILRMRSFGGEVLFEMT